MLVVPFVSPLIKLIKTMEKVGKLRPPNVGDILDIPEPYIDYFFEHSKFRDEKSRIHAEIFVRFLFQALPTSVILAQKYNIMGQVFRWADQLNQRLPTGRFQKKFLLRITGKLLTRLIPFVGTAMVAKDIVDIVSWVDENFD